MNVGSLFSGIGGLDLGLERAGMRVRWQCEADPYCRRVLAHHWPGVPCYPDIRELDGSVEPVELVCGGFPCQPVSFAGKGLAQQDERWLWPEFARVVGLLRPRFVIVENVPGLLRRGIADVISSLAEIGYDAEWEAVSAAVTGAPHLRERIFVIAYLADTDGVAGEGWSSTTGKVVRHDAFQQFGRRGRLADHWQVEPDVGRVADGFPDRVAELRALGNAVVPQVAELIGRMLLNEVASAPAR